MASLELQQLVKRFGSVQVLHGVDLKIDDGEFVVFVGPSGCGKSTLLRVIAGLEEASGGEILIDGEAVSDVPAAKRGLAMVFQSYALYPHMSVRKNLSFGLETLRTPKPEIKRRVTEAAEILQITPLLDRRPGQLSGGQRQRVAIGRAIVREPKIFLFDEPLSNLDAELRVQMRVEINKLHRRLGATMIFVTHDQVEAMTLADRIVVLRAGVIEQVGTPLDLYNHPANVFVAGFIGSPRMNFLAAEVAGRDDKGLEIGGRSGIRVRVQAAGTGSQRTGDKLTIGIRPEDLRLADPAKAMFSGEVQLAEHLGGETFLYVTLASGETIVVEVQGQVTGKAGERVGIDFDASAYHVFAEDGRVLTRRSADAGTPHERREAAEAPLQLARS
jgi:multiple sugar transport system ATP-binding protein